MKLKNILKRLPKYDNPEPTTAPMEQLIVLSLIAKAIENGDFTYTSRRSIRIYQLNTIDNNGMVISSIEVEWKLND